MTAAYDFQSAHIHALGIDAYPLHARAFNKLQFFIADSVRPARFYRIFAVWLENRRFEEQFFKAAVIQSRGSSSADIKTSDALMTLAQHLRYGSYFFNKRFHISRNKLFSLSCVYRRK